MRVDSVILHHQIPGRGERCIDPERIEELVFPLRPTHRDVGREIRAVHPFADSQEVRPRALWRENAVA